MLELSEEIKLLLYVEVFSIGELDHQPCREDN